MADGTIHLERAGSVAAPRALGRLSVEVRAGADGATRLSGLHQGGCLRLLFPDTGEDAVTAIALNTGGGLTGGDRLSVSATAEGGHLVLSTQAAERDYRAAPETHASVKTNLTIGAGARLDWLPQETILFDNSALARDLDVDMAPDATFLMVEPLVLGRQAMGESLSQVHLRDRIRIRRGGVLVFADMLRLSGDVPAWTTRAATVAGGVAMATVVMAAPGAEAHLAAARALLPWTGAVTGGASLQSPGILVARIVARDSFDLRRVLIPLLRTLGERPLPRTWTM